MSARGSILAGLLVVLSLVCATAGYAAVTKYTFNDVSIGEQIVEIEAAVKSVKKGDFSTCSYCADDDQECLGYDEDDVFAGATAEEVLDFCVDHFEDRTNSFTEHRPQSAGEERCEGPNS